MGFEGRMYAPGGGIPLITIGSINRDEAARRFYFLEEGIEGDARQSTS
jgi:hypothetical protein